MCRSGVFWVGTGQNTPYPYSPDLSRKLRKVLRNGTQAIPYDLTLPQSVQHGLGLC